MKDIPYFPKIVSVSRNPKTARLVVDINLYTVVTDEEKRVVFTEKLFGTLKPKLYYNFSITEEALEQLNGLVENPSALSGLAMNFRIWENQTWLYKFTRLHSLFAKTMYLQYNGLDLGLHRFENQSEEEELV